MWTLCLDISTAIYNGSACGGAARWCFTLELQGVKPILCLGGSTTANWHNSYMVATIIVGAYSWCVQEIGESEDRLV